jgi:hypothetical protein
MIIPAVLNHCRDPVRESLAVDVRVRFLDVVRSMEQDPAEVDALEARIRDRRSSPFHSGDRCFEIRAALVSADHIFTITDRPNNVKPRTIIYPRKESSGARRSPFYGHSDVIFIQDPIRSESS